MFTGLVQALGEVLESLEELGGRRLTVRWPGLDELADGPIQIGESIAVNGCCLTVIEHSDDWFAFQAGPETLIKTNLGQLHKGESQSGASFKALRQTWRAYCTRPHRHHRHVGGASGGRPLGVS